jgi:anti-anti-sigma regulatory factor
MPTSKNAEQRILNLSGALNVERAASLKKELAEAVAAPGPVLVSLSLAEDIDLACLQALYAAKRSCAAAGVEFHFIGSVPSRIAKRLAACGFLRGCPERAEDFEAGLTGF